MGELGCGLSNMSPPILFVARFLPGLNTLLQTLSLRAAIGVVDEGVAGVVGVAGLAGIDTDLWNLLPSPSISKLTPSEAKAFDHNYKIYKPCMHMYTT